MKNWKGPIAWLLCLVLFFSLTACGKRETEEPETTEQTDALVVEDIEDAIECLQTMGEDWGYDNALSGLTEKSTAAIDGDSYYRLQQNYQGIPVYGRTVVCTVDEDGAVTSITGNVLDVDEGIDLTPTVTAGEVETVIGEYLVRELGWESAPEIPEPAAEDLCIYDPDGSQARLAYAIDVSVYTFLVDARSGELLDIQCRLSTEQGNMVGDLVGQSGTYEEITYLVENGTFCLADNTRGIVTYSAVNEPTASPIPLVGFFVKVNVLSDTLPVCWQQGETPDPEAVDAYVNCQITYDYFDRVLNRTSADGNGQTFIGVVVGMENSRKDDGTLKNWQNNGSSDSNLEENSLFLAFGSWKDTGDSCARELDCMAHEFTHGVVAFSAGLYDDGEPGAINEGLSDIFGELVQSWHSGTAPDWHAAGIQRDMADPANGGHPACVTDPNNSGEDYVHGYSTVISHAAYLMWKGIDGNAEKKIGTEALAQLWYRAMLMMPSDCSFTKCRQLVEWAALSVDGLTESQMECIGEAFDAVGIFLEETDPMIMIRCDKNIRPGDPLLVYGKNEELHPNYTLYVQSTYAQNTPAMSDAILSDLGLRYDKTFLIMEPQAFSLDLPTGYYTFTVRDWSSPELSYSFTVSVTDEGTDGSIELYTDFGDAITGDALVTDAYYDVIYDDYFSLQNCCYHIPQIVLNNTRAAETNTQIYLELYGLLDQWIYSVDSFPQLSEMAYTWGRQDDVVSVLVGTDYMTVSWPEYFIYNISVETGALLSDEEVLAACGLTEDEFYALAKAALQSHWDSRSSISDMVGEAAYRSLVDKTLADENIMLSRPYLNGEGELCIVANVFSAAGADSYWCLLNTMDGSREDHPACTGEHPAAS